MSFLTAHTLFWYGTATYSETPSTYCQHNPSASDYGKCHNIVTNKAIFVQTDTGTYPTLPCEADNTCVRFTSTTYVRTLPPPGSSTGSAVVFSYSGKQAILQFFHARSHSNLSFAGRILYLQGLPVPTPSGLTAAYLWFLPSHNYELASWPIYDPVSNYKAYLNPYTITTGNVNILRWYGNIFTSSATINVYEGGVNNIWYAADVAVSWAYEASPLAVIPLDYDREYVPYQELRNAFGYAHTGVDQPGWNADDIINILRELFPNRAWSVFDDRTHTLYLYNLTPDFIPDWLVERLAPISMKVLKTPSDSSIAKAWLDELNRRNAYNMPSSAEI
jgi:hypothetical protein